MKLDDGADLPDIQIKRMTPEQVFEFAMENIKFDLMQWLADPNCPEPNLDMYPTEAIIKAREDLIEFASKEELDESETNMWSDMVAVLSERLGETYH